MRVISGIILSLLSVIAFSSPGSWMPQSKLIKEIIVEGSDSGKALIVIEGGVPASHIPEACRVGANGTYNTVYLNTDKGKAIYSMALSAYMNNKPVKLALACAGNRPLITHIRF